MAQNKHDFDVKCEFYVFDDSVSQNQVERLTYMLISQPSFMD